MRDIVGTLSSRGEASVFHGNKKRTLLLFLYFYLYFLFLPILFLFYRGDLLQLTLFFLLLFFPFRDRTAFCKR